MKISWYTWWQKGWGHKPPQFFTLTVALLTAGIVCIPLIYVLYKAGMSDGGVWGRLFHTRLGVLLGNTLQLTVTVTILAIIIGVSAAWLVVRTDVPGGKVFAWLLPLPLGIPVYIGALTYIAVFGYGGILRLWDWRFLNIYSFWGVTAVFVLFTFPYVFLIVAAALKSMNANLEEAARAGGHNHWQSFWHITLPLLRPAIGAGGLLVALYVLSDFGTVAMLRYDTFTSAIYTQLVGRYDRSAAAVLSTALMVITVLAASFEWYNRAKSVYYQTSGTYRTGYVLSLGPWRYPAFCFLLTVVVFSVLLPVALLVSMAARGLAEGALGSVFWRYTVYSLLSAGAAATVAAIAALPVAYVSVRNGGVLGRTLSRLTYAGYVLPGVIIALGVIFIFHRFLPAVYGTWGVLVTAYVIRFLPQSLQAQESALTLISPRLEEAGASCGYNGWEVMWKITFPLITPGILAGWLLTFLSALKELPVTLLLRPPGFDTLAVRIWIEASEGFYTLAAPAALLLVMISVIPLRLLAHTKTWGGSP